jgi:DNA-binding NtrC family response regulator
MKILVIDDEETIHHIVAVSFAMAGGFELHFATNGDDALKRYVTHGPYDAVLTDCTHPGPNGIELAQVMRRRNPTQAVAMLTGNADQSAARSRRELDIPLLAKPCELRNIPQVVEAARARMKK